MATLTRWQLANTPQLMFKHDIESFITQKLSTREAEIFRLFLYGGRITQTDIAEHLGICQATVANTLKTILKLVKDEFYGEEYGRQKRVGCSL
jgi:DNA-binding NarL/FixJ family response regulator